MQITVKPQEFRIFDKSDLAVSLCAEQSGKLYLRFTGNFLLTVDVHQSDIKMAHTMDMWQENGQINSEFALTVFRNTVESFVLRSKELLAKHDPSNTSLWNVVSKDIAASISLQRRKYLEEQFRLHRRANIPVRKFA